MNILIIAENGENKVILDTNFVPRVGDIVDIFCNPRPKVEIVLLYPSEETLRSLETDTKIDVIVTVG